jgi:hypothetical protein
MADQPLTDPLLRQALRRLYPEWPTFIRRCLIPNPATPLHPPHITQPLQRLIVRNPERPTTQVVDADRLLAMLQATAETINGIAPWTNCSVAESWDGAHVTSAAHGDLGDLRSLAPAGVPLRFRLSISTDREHFAVLLAHSGGSLRLGIGEQWIAAILTHSHGDKHIAAHVGWPVAGGRTARALVHQGQSVLLADGLHSISGGGPHVMAASLRSDQDSHEDLLQRWRALDSRDDRQRVALFWLGHTHPVLSQLGLDCVRAMTPRTVTPRTVTPRAPRA